MSPKIKLSAIAALALAVNCIAAAQDTPETPYADSMLTLSAPAIQGYGGIEYAPLLQDWLTQQGWYGPLDEWNIKLSGYGEVGYTFNFINPPGGYNGPGFEFMDKAEDPNLDQIDLKIMRPINYSGDAFDMGFTVEGMYGADARFTQANGSNFYGSGYADSRTLTFFADGAGNPTTFVQSTGFPGQGSPNNQFDFLQANITVNLPVGTGIMVMAGKEVTPFGYESINPLMNPLYTHSYIFAMALPKTLTGITAAYAPDEYWSFMGGVVVGWDMAFQDINNAPSYMLQAGYKVPDEGWDVVFTTLFGPEQEDNDGDWRWTLDATAHYKWDNITLGVEGVLGYEPNVGMKFTNVQVGAIDFADLRQFTGEDATWSGFALYGSFPIEQQDRFVIQTRLEYFNDWDGGRWFTSDVWSGTLGVNIRPFPDDRYGQNLIFRPELRWDWSNAEVFDGGGGLSGTGQNNQITLSADLIFAF
ncbi:MAG: outer membrane beta-barrel protein [Tepidisphaeraceae bacterium]